MLVFKLVDRDRKGWDWEVLEESAVIAHGRQKTRFGARYQAERALFELLATGWKRPFNSDPVKR